MQLRHRRELGRGPLFAFAQRLFRALLLADVHHGHDHARDLIVRGPIGKYPCQIRALGGSGDLSFRGDELIEDALSVK